MKKWVVLYMAVQMAINMNGQQTGTFKDTRDGKIYKTVKIGDQLWFAENLAFSVSDGCWAYNNDKDHIQYGYLYNWETAKTTCPAGWHLPGKAEWILLVDYLGGDSKAISKMKTPKSWKEQADEKKDQKTTNISGFSVLPAGRRYTFGNFTGLGEEAFFWSDTSEGESNAWMLSLHQNNDYLFFIDDSKMEGCSVRCLKD